MKIISHLVALAVAGLALAPTLSWAQTAEAEAGATEYVSPRAEALVGLPERESHTMIWGGGEPKFSSYTSKMVPVLVDINEQIQMPGYKWPGPSDGTTMNAELVTFHPTHQALGQGDLLDRLNGKPIPGKPGMNYAFHVLHPEIAYECHFLVSKAPTYRNLADVWNNAFQLTVGMGSELSGSYGSWHVNLTDIYPELAVVPITTSKNLGDVNSDGKTNSADLLHAVAGDPYESQMAFVTMRPDPGKGLFALIEELDLHIIPVVGFELEEIYGPPRKIRVANSGENQHVLTSCTPVQVITGALEEDAMSRLEFQRLKASHDRWNRSVDKQKATELMISQFLSWRDWLDSFLEASEEEFGPIYKAIKDARN